MFWLQSGASDELHRLSEMAAEELLKAQKTAAHDTDKVTGIYGGYARSPYGQPSALEHARPPAPSQVCAGACVTAIQHTLCVCQQ